MFGLTYHASRLERRARRAALEAKSILEIYTQHVRTTSPEASSDVDWISPHQLDWEANAL